MSRLSLPTDEERRAPRVDREGELYRSPVVIKCIWAGLVVLTVLEAANEVFGIGGSNSLYESWFHDAVIASAAILLLARAAYEPTARKAWLAFGLAMACWATGSISWSAVYSGQPNPPYPTFADVLWLLWYPLMGAGIVWLIRMRVPRFELHRWMDGLAVMLMVLAAGSVFIVEPVVDQARIGTLATVVEFGYPVLDVLLMGSILGVYGLLGWRPDRMWLLIGLGTLMSTIADAAFAVQLARGVADDTHYEFVWTLGALLIAYAGWAEVPEPQADTERPTGLRAVALALVALALAAGIQLYALFRPVGRSERVLTVAVLAVSAVQIIITRPRRDWPTTAPLPSGDVGETDVGETDAGAGDHLMGEANVRE